jgi:hypothetical protein
MINYFCPSVLERIPTHDDVTLNVTSKKRISELMCLREQTNAAHK